MIEEGWVTEGAAGYVPRGRRPRSLHLNAGRISILGVDLRPETTTIGLAGLDARFVGQASFDTPSDPEAFATALARAAAEIRAAHPRVRCEGIGVSLPGRVDAEGRLVFAPNLGWAHVNLRHLVQEAVNLPAVLENAANACALAELWFGRHPEHVRHLVAVTVSEGIGVGLLLNGQLVHGAGALAGEFGHITVDDSGPPCRCGKRGCWERYASSSAAVQHYLSESTGTEVPLQDTRGGLRFEELLNRAATGDEHAVRAVERMARYLGIGIANLMTGLAPEVIVIIGEVTGAWDRVGPIVSDVVAQRTLANAPTRIVATDRATQPRLRGAVTLVVQQHFGALNIA